MAKGKSGMGRKLVLVLGCCDCALRVARQVLGLVGDLKKAWWSSIFAWDAAEVAREFPKQSVAVGLAKVVFGEARSLQRHWNEIPSIVVLQSPDPKIYPHYIARFRRSNCDLSP